jgi:16S rRNA processing protein RimM
MIKRFLETGRVVSTQGLKGEVRVTPWCDSPDFLTQFDRLYLRTAAQGPAPAGADTPPGALTAVESARVHKTLALIKFAGVDDIDAAMPLVGAVLYIDRGWVRLPAGSYFEQDLLGLEVVDAQTGLHYGSVCEVSRTGANDVYHIRSGGRVTLIPAIRDVVRSIEPENGVMRITPLPGLFDED